MTAIENIRSAQAAALVDDDGDAVNLTFGRPLTAEEIDSLQQQVGVALPEELRSLLAFCSGIEGCSVEIDFTGASMMFGQDEVFPNGLPIAADGFGNFWVLDITPQTPKVAPVFFACHDAPVILYQSPDLSSFLSEVFRMNSPHQRSLVSEVPEDRILEVWRKNPGVLDQPSTFESSDDVLRAFASALPAHFQIVDLRKVDPGMGFSWGRYGPRTEVRRHGYERIFAYAKPPKTGLLAKLFGR